MIILRRHENSGGAFRVQIYSPYVVINKTGLAFQLRSLRSTRAGVPLEVAGEKRLCMTIFSHILSY
jgi:vacuolar protein sorting-associated protein 13A/C